MKQFVAIGLLIFGVQSLQAQLLERDTARWSFALASSFFISKGNVDRLLWKSDASLKHLGPGWGASTDNTYLYGSFGGFKTERDFFSRNFLYLQPKKRIYPYLMGWLEKNLRRKIDFRYQLGPGATWVALKKESHALKFSLTATYEHTDFNSNDFLNAEPQSSDVIETWRLTGRLFGYHGLWKDRLRLQYEFWYQQSLQHGDNYRYHTDVSIQAPLSKAFSVKINLNYSFENVVLRGVKQGDLFWTMGLNFKKP
ncbi:MAG: DUF481 domain-containing protein [Saprospiraceae bacterium]